MSNNNKNVGFWGYWYGKNFGDIWIKNSIDKKFSSEFNLNFIMVTQNDINEMKNKYKLDYFVIGGGGLINGPLLRDPFNKKIPIKYSTIGLGGEIDILEKNKLSKFINNSDLFGVRDSYNLLNYSNNAQISGDCTFLYPLKVKEDINLDRMNIKIVWRDPHSLLKWDKSKFHMHDGLVLNDIFLDYILGNSDTLLSNEIYLNKLNNLLKPFNTNFNDLQIKEVNDEFIYEEFKDIDLVIGMRYHSIVASIQLGIPVIAISIYQKVETLMNDCELSDFCIKINELDKIPTIIKNIKVNYKNIRDKMLKYTKNNEKIINDYSEKLIQTIKNTN